MNQVKFPVALLLMLGGAACAQAPAPGHADPAHQPAAAAAPLADGEVRRIDREQAKLTLRHGEIASLGMPAMTMVFRVANPDWLAGLKPGDRVQFQAASVNGVLTVTELRTGPAAR